MKGFIFSMDMIIAASIFLLLAVFLTGLSFTYSNPELSSQRYFLISKDMLNLLKNTEIQDIQDFDTVSEYFSDGYLTSNDLNKSVLEAIGTFWVNGTPEYTERATNLTKEFFNRTLPLKFGYEILLDRSSIHRNDIAGSGSFVSRSFTIISGLEQGKPISGFVARAFAVELRVNVTDVFPFNPEGSGNEGPAGVAITKKFRINSSTIHNATLFLSVHHGTSENIFNEISVNAKQLGDDNITWLYDVDKTISGKGTNLRVGFINITNFVKEGWNNITLDIRSEPSFHGHIHPGTRAEVKYSVIGNTSVSNDIFQRFYFDNITSREQGNKKSGAWAIMPFFIPKGVVVTNISMHIRGENVNNISPSQMPASVPNKYNVQVYLNNGTIDLFNPDQSDPNIGDAIDRTYNLTWNFTEGTNVVSVYLNSYGDEFWGEDETVLYSDPENNPEGSSFIQVEYGITSSLKQKFGYIEIGVTEGLGGTQANPKAYNKTFTNVSRLSETFLHMVQLDSDNVTVRASYEGQSPIQTFRTLQPGATPSSIFIDPDFLNFSNGAVNTLNISDICSLPPATSCNITPESSFEFRTLLKASVGFGKVFPNDNDAVEDAIKRLNETLGDFAYSATIETLNSSVSGVQSLWGPAIFEVRAWR